MCLVRSIALFPGSLENDLWLEMSLMDNSSSIETTRMATMLWISGVVIFYADYVLFFLTTEALDCHIMCSSFACSKLCVTAPTANMLHSDKLP